MFMMAIANMLLFIPSRQEPACEDLVMKLHP